MFKTVLIGLLIVACASITVAQSADYKRFEFFVGYSHNRFDTGISSDDPIQGDIHDEHEAFHGLNTSITGNVSRYVGLKFDFSAHFKHRALDNPAFPNNREFNSRLFTYLGGVQVKDNSSETTVKPFVHALVGAAHLHQRQRISFEPCTSVSRNPCGDLVSGAGSDTAFAGAFGGGVDTRVSNRVDFRAIQLDYNPTKLFSGTQHNLRIGVGIVLH